MLIFQPYGRRDFRLPLFQPRGGVPDFSRSREKINMAEEDYLLRVVGMNISTS
jgi:hypothetical protein